MANNTVLSSGVRKYTPIWQKLKAEGVCIIKCPREDTLIIARGVAKERGKDKNRPKDKILVTTVTDTGITFRLKEDTSINNL